MTPLKIIATVALSCVVLATAYLCIIFSICTFGGIGEPFNRLGFALLDLLDVAIMIGAVILIARIHRKK